MIAIRLDRVHFNYASEPLLEDLSWDIHDNRCIGLIGANGSGKSTLLKLLRGELTCDRGKIIRIDSLVIGYLPQEPDIPPDQSILDAVLMASGRIQAVKKSLDRVEAKIADPAVYNHPSRLAAALDEQADLLDQFTQLGGTGFEGEVRTQLLQFGFSEEEFQLSVGVLSGGQKKLLGLTQIISNKPDLLLLDEPDNHLDLSGKRYLEKYLREFSGAVILVSHDRYLLDLIVDEIVEIEQGRLNLYPGNYSEYAFVKRQHLLRQQQLYQAQQKEIDRLQQSAQRLLTWGQVYDNEKFIRRGKNILKRLERIDQIERPLLETPRIGLELQGWRGSSKVLEFINLGKNFIDPDQNTSQVLFSGLNFTLWHGERVGLVGPNGAGKSILFRLILGELAPSIGEIILGPSIRIGYYAQEHETLNYDRTLIETVRQHAAMSENQAVAFLGRFLFPYNQQRMAVKTLSGGERSRLQLALLMLSGANFLLLDEPTNNLDIPSAEVLEAALDDFEGTVLVISHDRYFLERVVTQVVVLQEGELTTLEGTYRDYLMQTHQQKKPG